MEQSLMGGVDTNTYWDDTQRYRMLSGVEEHEEIASINEYLYNKSNHVPPVNPTILGTIDIPCHLDCFS